MSREKYRKVQNHFCSNEKKKVTKFDKDGNKNVMIISYRIKCIDSTRFMASSLSNLVDNLAEGIHKT